jgi:hypothetical protein
MGSIFKNETTPKQKPCPLMRLIESQVDIMY